jgi:hypothetical protein
MHVEVLRFIENEKDFAPAEIEPQIFENPAVVASTDGASSLSDGAHELIGPDEVRAVDVKRSPAVPILGNL